MRVWVLFVDLKWGTDFTAIEPVGIYSTLDNLKEDLKLSPSRPAAFYWEEREIDEFPLKKQVELNERLKRMKVYRPMANQEENNYD